jgi:hypothetical protein
MDIYDTYYMHGVAQAIEATPSFFKDRYFGNNKVFKSKKVLMDQKAGKRKIALFVDKNAGDIASARGGFETYELEPSMIAPSRPMTLDDLEQRGFGESLVVGSTEEERASKLQLEDMTDLSEEIGFREEWMAAQALRYNGVQIQEYIDAKTTGKKNNIMFYNGSNPASYTVGGYWTTWAQVKADVRAMCASLSKYKLPAKDLILGHEVWDAIENLQGLKDALDNRSIEAGKISEEAIAPGVSFVGILNFGGFKLNVFVSYETYIDESNNEVYIFPEKGACVTAPDCGETLYGAVTQIPQGEKNFVTFEGTRIPKLVVNEEKDMRKLRLASRPITVPKFVAPWRMAEDVIQ